MIKYISALWKKMFYSPYFFTIALRKKTGENILDNPRFKADYVIPSTYKKWVADPILVDNKGKTYLFYEAYVDGKGRIEVVEVEDACKLSLPTVVLEDSCHYSYPYVFSFRDEWYMIPESSARNEVSLYKAEEFPQKWKKLTVLLREKAVDTTILEQNGSLYMLTYLPCPETERVKPEIYHMHWENEFPMLKPLKWTEYDGLKCRGAGPVFEILGRQIRPAQENEEQSYGNSVLFYQVEIKNSEYQEYSAGKLRHDQIEAGKIWFDGLHTYSVSDKFEAIDLRCREFEPGKVFRILKNRLIKR